MSDIVIEAEIGEGAFGRVYRARAVNLKNIRESEIVAVKQLKSIYRDIIYSTDLIFLIFFRKLGT